MKSFLRFYLNSLDKYPIRTKLITSGIMAACSDLMIQKIEKSHDHRSDNYGEFNTNIDWKRTLNMASWGFLIVPFMHAWYNILERVFPMTEKRRNAPAVTLKRMTMDQILFAPLSLAAFLTYMSLIEHKTWSECKDKIKNDLPSTLLMNYKVWPLAQCINLWIVPVQHRVFVISFVGFFWNAYLSHVQHHSNRQNMNTVPRV